MATAASITRSFAVGAQAVATSALGGWRRACNFFSAMTFVILFAGCATVLVWSWQFAEDYRTLFEPPPNLPTMQKIDWLLDLPPIAESTTPELRIYVRQGRPPQWAFYERYAASETKAHERHEYYTVSPDRLLVGAVREARGDPLRANIHSEYATSAGIAQTHLLDLLRTLVGLDRVEVEPSGYFPRYHYSVRGVVDGRVFELEFSRPRDFGSALEEQAARLVSYLNCLRDIEPEWDWRRRNKYYWSDHDHPDYPKNTCTV